MLDEKEEQIKALQQQLQQVQANQEAQLKLEELQQQIQEIQDKHKDDPKLPEFISETISLNDQLLQQEEIFCQKISQWNYFCQESDKITSHVVDLRNDYDLINEKINDYLAWQKTEEGRKAGAPIINENHKEILFSNWDAQIRRAERAAEKASTAANTLTDCVNDNLHKANLISETVPGYLPQVNQLQAEWRQKAEEREKSIQRLIRLNWDSY